LPSLNKISYLEVSDEQFAETSFFLFFLRRHPKFFLEEIQLPIKLVINMVVKRTILGINSLIQVDNPAMRIIFLYFPGNLPPESEGRDHNGLNGQLSKAFRR